MPEFMLRPMKRPDCDELAALHAQCFPDPWPAHGFDALLMTGATGFVTIKDSAIVGVLMYRAAAGEAEILTYAVAPAHRRTGIAAHLMARAIAALQADGVNRFFLDVAVDNAPALALYQKWNFTEIARRSRYYRHGATPTDALIMNLELQPATVDNHVSE